jgi:hypothetical protein
VPDRLAVFLDYQNVHLAAWSSFCAPCVPVEAALVHPLALAERILARRRRGGELVAVRAYRGRPNPNRQPTLAAANDAQTAQWERDPRVQVVRRNLNYRQWPARPPQEKGIDVALAVDLIRTAMLAEYDVAVVFSGDTDLLPAIETAFRHTNPSMEIACWVGGRPLWFPELVQQRRYLPYCHFLDVEDFEAARDLAKYR